VCVCVCVCVCVFVCVCVCVCVCVRARAFFSATGSNRHDFTVDMCQHFHCDSYPVGHEHQYIAAPLCVCVCTFFSATC
jgi:hypothetical protein